MNELQHTLRQAAKAGAIRIKAASAMENRLGISPGKSIILKRAEAVGLLYVVSVALAAEGDRFIADLSDAAALECIDVLNRCYTNEQNKS